VKRKKVHVFKQNKKRKNTLKGGVMDLLLNIIIMRIKSRERNIKITKMRKDYKEMLFINNT
jgi:hypothetical protein